jgi:heme exporter protein D
MRRKKYRMLVVVVVVVVVVWELENSVQQMQLLASNVTRERERDSRRSSRNSKTHPLRQTLGMALPPKKKSL